MINIYHSYQITQKGVKAWSYYQIGTGLKILLDPDISFKPGNQVIKSFVPRKGNLVSRYIIYFFATIRILPSFVVLGELQFLPGLESPSPPTTFFEGSPPFWVFVFLRAIQTGACKLDKTV